MTDESRGAGRTVGPPWSVDVVADLHAGVFDEREAAELWPLVNADPDARAILEALEATTADLAMLTAGPAEPMPAHFAERLDAALARESGIQPGLGRDEAPVAPVVSLEAARRRRNKGIGWGAGILAVAAAAVAAVVITLPTGQSAGDNTVALPPPAQSGHAPSVGGNGNGAEALVGQALGVRDFGPLGSEERLDACMTAAGLDPKIRPAGIRPVTVGEQTGVMVILTTGKLAQYRTVAFGPDCGPGNPSILFDKVIGQK